MANVFNMTFEELLKQAGGTEAAPATEVPAVEETAPSSEPMAPAEVSKTEGEEMSFEAMVEAAQKAQAAKTDVPLDMNPPEEPKEEPKAEEPFPKTEEAAQQVSFDDLVRQAAAAQNGETAKAEERKEEPKVEESKVEEPKAEEPKVEKPKEEEHKVEELKVEEPKAEEPKVEESKEESKAKPKKAAKGKKGKKAETPAEPPVDQTEDYRVDLEPKVQKSSGSLTLDTLFTKEELADLRKDIRTLVRREIKSAVVDAVKELLHEFSK